VTSSWTNVLARRDLVRELVLSDLRASSAQSRFGWVWWLIDPLLMMLIYSAIVVGLLGRGKAGYAPYPIFILGALITWKHFAACAGKATKVLSSKEALIKSVPFPTIVLPLSQILAGTVFFIFGLAVVLAASFIWRSDEHSGSPLPLVQLPLLLAAQVAVITGLCLPLACISVLIRDLSGVMSHLLRIGFYLSPGLYGLDLVEIKLDQKLGAAGGDAAMFVYLLNPFAPLITGYRQCIFYGEFLSPQLWLMLIVEAGVVFTLGWMVYQHYDRRVIKFL
jgi:ABC-2 type transport system permease protein